MAAELLDGKRLARDLRVRLKTQVEDLTAKGLQPGLAVVVVGADPASRTYVDMKKKACAQLGVRSEEYQLSADAAEETVLRLLRRLNADPAIHGILVQRPLPAQVDVLRITDAIAPEKDVDCFHPANVGRLVTGGARLYPCTPLGIVTLLDEAKFPFEGAHAAVVGRSPIVGRPVALMLLERNCTVTVCHTRTRDVAAVVRQADLVVACAGRAELVRGEWLKEGAWVVDVGTNRTADGRQVGDVDFAGAQARAARISPVPGGVGPMTIAMLMENTVLLARRALEARAAREPSAAKEPA